jgi:anti-anti-sigma factor
VGARFAIDVETIDDGIVVAHVRGEIDMATTPGLVERLLPVAESAPSGMAVDLSQVTFMGAAGLHALEEFQHTLRRHGGRLAVVAPGGIPLRVLKVTRMTQALAVVPTMDAARLKLGPES